MMYHDSKRKILLTGATGLIGSYLTIVLLQNGYKVYALSRRKDTEIAKDRVLSRLNFWSKDVLSQNFDNLKILEGDIAEENLGLDKQNIDLLINEVSEIYHSAAVTRFNWPLEMIRKVNVDGVKNVFELALKCKNEGILKKINHISSAYVCGDYNGTFKEDDLDVGQGFSTTYEQSKFEAEKLVDAYREKGLWIDVFRPPIVIGESTTGKTVSFNQSFYQAMHFLSLGLLEFLPCYKMQLNLVYLDELCWSIFCISLNTEERNEKYHVFNSKAYSAEQFLDIFYNFIDMKKPAFIHPDKFIREKTTPALNMLLKHNFYFFNRKTTIDSIYTNNLLNKKGFFYSDIDENKLCKIFEYALKEGIIKEVKYD